MKKVLAPWRWFYRQRRRNKIIIILVLLVVAFILYRRFNKPNPADQYELEAARIDSIVELVSETGNVTAAGATPLYSTTTGMVEEVYVENGSRVSEGQVLFKVKSSATQQEQKSALATYLGAVSQLETAQATQLSLQAQMFGEWDQYKELAESDEYEDSNGDPREGPRNEPEFQVPQKEWLAAEASYKKQQQVINQAKAQVAATWEAYQATQDSQVKAVFAGEVRNLGVSEGSMVIAANPSTTSMPPSLILIQPEITPTIQLSVGESDALKVQEGQSVDIEFDALPNQTFTGVVDRVDTYATPAQGVVNYNVYVELTETSEQIRAGMTASLDITVASQENVLTVPSSAVKPYEGGRAVRVLDQNGEIEFIPVETGAKGNGRTEILSGISEGTMVIVALGNDQIQPSSGGFF